MKIISSLLLLLGVVGIFILSSALPSLASLTPLPSHAIPSNSSQFSIRQLVNQYYESRENKSTARNRPPADCYPSGPSCIDVACDLMGSLGCDEIDEIKQVGRACRGNADGQCLQTVCHRLGSLGCDSVDEVTTVARFCVGNYDTQCFESVCNKLGALGCDEIREVQEVLRYCAGN